MFETQILLKLSENAFCGQPKKSYTPFCDDRKEMDGFRFWNGGYWKSHLNGRRYHISAIYVVDLKRFRQLAAGDRLRGQYQGQGSANSLRSEILRFTKYGQKVQSDATIK